MRSFCIFLFSFLFLSAPCFSYEYYWENLDKKNLKVDAGSYVIRPEGVFFNVKDTKQNKICTMQQYTEYSEAENRFYYYIGECQTCSLEDYVKYGRAVCSPLTAKPAQNFETVIPDDTEDYKWQLVTFPIARAECIKHKPDYWVSTYYRADVDTKIKKAFLAQYKKAKKAHQVPKMKAPLDVFAEVTYVILPDGSLKGAEISSSSGNEFFNNLALEAVKSAEPFLVLPLSFDNDSLECTFRYELRVRSAFKFEEKFVQIINK